MSLAMLRPASPQATGVSYFLLPQLESREAPHLTMLRPLSFMRTPLHSTDLLLHRHSRSLTHTHTHTYTHTLTPIGFRLSVERWNWYHLQIPSVKQHCLIVCNKATNRVKKDGNTTLWTNFNQYLKTKIK